MSVDTPTYESEVQRLDHDVILRAGAWVRDALRLGDTCAIAYEPDNGTSYQLVFVAVADIVQLSDDREVPVGCGPSHVLVTKCNGTGSDWTYPFAIEPGGAPRLSYVCAKTRSNVADGTAITALFRAIAGEAIV